MHIYSYSEFLNEAFKVNADFIEQNIMKNRKAIVSIANKGNSESLTKYLMKIFNNRFKFEDKTVLEVDKLAIQLNKEMNYITNKIKKYPQIKPYLKEELEEYKQLSNYIKNKKKTTIQIKFFTYNTFYKVNKSGFFIRFIHWINRKLTPTLKYMEFNRENPDYKKIIVHDFKLFMAYYNFIDNEFGVIYDNDFAKTINDNNINLFAKQLKAVLKHELVHQKDFLNKNIGELRTNDMFAPYHQQHTEIKSWASGTIEELRSNNFTDKEIEKILLEPDKHKQEVHASQSLKVYYENYYHFNRMLYYKYVSECLDDLNKHYEKVGIK